MAPPPDDPPEIFGAVPVSQTAQKTDVYSGINSSSLSVQVIQFI